MVAQVEAVLLVRFKMRARQIRQDKVMMVIVHHHLEPEAVEAVPEQVEMKLTLMALHLWQVE
jgi:hypothetical protein